MKKSARGRRSLQKEIKRLKNQNSNLNKALAVAKEEKAGLEIIVAELAGRTRQVELEKENRTLGETLAALRNDLDAQHQLIESLRKKNMRLNSEVEQQQHLSRLYGRETRDFIKEVLALNRCDTSCPAFDLCQKRVLIVGGITRMESLYRKVIESSGGVFDYHDGYMKKGIKRLESSLKRADVVLCPVSCNSHAACSAVKSLAKKHNKTVHMLPTSSLSAVSQVIWGTAQGKGTIN